MPLQDATHEPDWLPLARSSGKLLLEFMKDKSLVHSDCPDGRWVILRTPAVLSGCILVFREGYPKQGTFYQVSPFGQLLIAKAQHRRDLPITLPLYQEFANLIERIHTAGVFVPPGCVYDLSEERLPSSD